LIDHIFGFWINFESTIKCTTGTSVELFKKITPTPTGVFIFGSHAPKEVRKTARCHISLLKPKGEQFADKPTA
jgi:hypothetical protein